MSEKARRTTEYLDHMLEAIRRIYAYVAGLDRRGFDRGRRRIGCAMR